MPDCPASRPPAIWINQDIKKSQGLGSAHQEPARVLIQGVLAVLIYLYRCYRPVSKVVALNPRDTTPSTMSRTYA